MFVYADNAATTKPSQVALDAMLPCLTDVYGNPSSLHSVGQKAAETLQAAVRLTIRPSSLPRGSARRRAKSTSFPPRLSTMLCCTR